MSIQDTIQDALEKCVQEGITIERGACFDWVHGEEGKPLAVNWAGAVLWTHRNEIPDFGSRTLGKLLGIDLRWFYRFTIGFDQNRTLSILDDTMKEVGMDDVSSMGQRLSRMFVPKTTMAQKR